jgi:hypothetical protein
MAPGPPGYELVDELGSGAAGTVHLARQVALDREVAIRRIVGGASSQDPVTNLRFERQARLLRRLDHPAIVRVYEVVRAEPDLFVVTEHVPGDDLRELLAAGRPAPHIAARVLSQIAAALDHAHERGVVHGGLQPANVLLGEDGAIKVGDFGLAALLEGQAGSRTSRTDAVEGLAYLAPELARGDLAVDRRADVYSLGVIAYELLVGRVPFPVDPADPYATVRAQMQDPPPRPGALVPGFPPLLEAALLWALQKPPERRPATAGELAAALRNALALPPTIGAYTETGGAPVRAGVPDAAAEGTEAGTARAGGRRWLVPALAAAGIGLVAVAGLAAGWALRGPAPAAPLAVTAITTSVDPAGGAVRCPRATVTLRATVATNGAGGTLTYQWLRPDGGPASTSTVALHAGQRAATVSLAVDYTGSTPSRGVAAVRVIAPDRVYSEPVTVSYACP